ncbi:MAG: hypothetical protein WBQ36_13295, partial [Desulfobaccales bacterium]
MTYSCDRLDIRIFALLLVTILAVVVPRAGFPNDQVSEVKAAPAAPGGSAVPAAPAVPVTQAAPAAAIPPAAPRAAKG